MCMQTCLTAALVLAALPRAVRRGSATILPRQASHALSKALPALALAAVALMSLARVGAVLGYYRAPLQVYSALPAVRAPFLQTARALLCSLALLPQCSRSIMSVQRCCR